MNPNKQLEERIKLLEEHVSVLSFVFSLFVLLPLMIKLIL